MMNDEKQLHWLVRPSTTRKLWIGSSVVLTLVVLAQTVIYVKGYFGFDAWFGFGAIYGFVSCLVMVLVAKLLGLLLKRPLDYYDEPQHHETLDPSHDKVKENSNGV
jgi:sterol desaturase/sphingolipid hydroxylase (fatty acid hydroxylase superfamily)